MEALYRSKRVLVVPLILLAVASLANASECYYLAGPGWQHCPEQGCNEYYNAQYCVLGGCISGSCVHPAGCSPCCPTAHCYDSIWPDGSDNCDRGICGTRPVLASNQPESNQNQNALTMLPILMFQLTCDRTYEVVETTGGM